MTGEEHIQTEAKAALTHKLNQLGYKPLPEQISKDCIKFVANNGDMREVILCFLNLDKDRSVHINQRDFDYTPRPDLLILLTVYMNDINPVLYLIPSMVFYHARQYISGERTARSFAPFFHLADQGIYQCHRNA